MFPIVSGEGFLPFFYPTSYKVLTDTSWDSALIALPTPLHSRGFEYDTAYVSMIVTYDCITFTSTGQPLGFNQFWWILWLF